jgi:HdeA/HdeB family
MPAAALRSARPLAGLQARRGAARRATRDTAAKPARAWRAAVSTDQDNEETTMKRVLMVLLALCSAAYAQQQPPPSASAPVSPPQPPGQTAAAPPVSSAQVAPSHWDVDRVRCSDLLGASDDDRASAAMFYYGYLAAKAGIHVIDVGRISDNIGKVMQKCGTMPSLTVPQAFREALRPSTRG